MTDRETYLGLLGVRGPIGETCKQFCLEKYVTPRVLFVGAGDLLRRGLGIVADDENRPCRTARRDSGGVHGGLRAEGITYRVSTPQYP